MQSLQNLLGSNALLVSFVLISVAFFCLAWVVATIARQLFALYQRNFLQQVDKGLRDVVVMMEPGQVFTLTLVTAVIIVPIILLTTNWVIALGLAVVIFIAPTMVLKVMKKRRSDEFVEQLPDALSAIASSLRSGLNLVKAFQQVAKNQPQPLAQEFTQVLVEYRVGTDLNDSLDDLARRIDRQDLLLMNSAIKISRTVGGNLADTLEVLSRTLREKSKVEGKIRALTSMGKAQGTLATVFPAFIGYVFYKVEPAAMSKLFVTPLGWIFLAVMGTMAVMAYFMIQKIVNVDV
ncbi:MAG: type II secretion system F family protein [Pseudomonadota bacterium]|nr:hypothetical protein [Pseudomonadales bacterium]MDY6919814.1 type II secretion system F family protein [Pseudomonadota bacterium]